MTKVANKIFVDTNILVYATMISSPFHSSARTALERYELDDELWISRQVIREYLATLIRPATALPLSDVISSAQSLENRYAIAEDSSLVTTNLFTLLNQGITTHVHDTNIVATMLVYGIPTLFINNPKDFAPFADTIRIISLV